MWLERVSLVEQRLFLELFGVFDCVILLTHSWLTLVAPVRGPMRLVLAWLELAFMWLGLETLEE